MNKIVASIGIAIALIFTTTGVATALTLQQAQEAVAGYNCNGSTCTKSLGSTVVTTSTTSATQIQLVDGRPGFFHSLGHFVPSSLVGDEGTTGSCEITTVTSVKELVYNGPNTSRDTAWTVNSSLSSTKSNC